MVAYAEQWLQYLVCVCVCVCVCIVCLSFVYCESRQACFNKPELVSSTAQSNKTVQKGNCVINATWNTN